MTFILKNLALVIIFGTLTANSLSAKKTTIKLNLIKGQQFEYVITKTKNAEPPAGSDNELFDQSMTLTLQLVVLEKLRDGNYLIQANYKRVIYEFLLQSTLRKYDTDVSYNEETPYDNLKDMTKILFKFEISPLGVVSNITGLDEFLNDKTLNVYVRDVCRRFGIKNIGAEIFNYIPKKKIEQGEKWVVSSPLPELNIPDYTIDYKLADTSPKEIKIEIHTNFQFESPKPLWRDGHLEKFKDNITQNGDIIVDTKTSVLLSKKIYQKAEILLYSTDTIVKATSVKQIKNIYRTTMKLSSLN